MQYLVLYGKRHGNFLLLWLDRYGQAPKPPTVWQKVRTLIWRYERLLFCSPEVLISFGRFICVQKRRQRLFLYPQCLCCDRLPATAISLNGCKYTNNFWNTHHKGRTFCCFTYYFLFYTLPCCCIGIVMPPLSWTRSTAWRWITGAKLHTGYEFSGQRFQFFHIFNRFSYLLCCVQMYALFSNRKSQT